MHDGLMVSGDHYDNTGLLSDLHDLLGQKFGIHMEFAYKQHETTVLDDIPDDFDETDVLSNEWKGILLN